MLTPLRKLITDIEAFDLPTEQRAIVESKKEVLADFQALVLAEGKNNKGQVRDDQYAPLTEYIKTRFGQGLGRVTDRVTFYMTGRLYASLEVHISSKTYSVKSPLETWDKMVARIGEANYGLDPERQYRFFDEIVRPGVREVLIRKTGLRF
jgi:hypothetical protein